PPLQRRRVDTVVGLAAPHVRVPREVVEALPEVAHDGHVRGDHPPEVRLAEPRYPTQVAAARGRDAAEAEGEPGDDSRTVHAARGRRRIVSPPPIVLGLRDR